jgi:hypothetical protein
VAPGSDVQDLAGLGDVRLGAGYLHDAGVSPDLGHDAFRA